MRSPSRFADKRARSFNPLRAAFRAYELIYVVANERDVVKLRANHRRNKVYLYPMRTTPEGLRAMFLGMLLRAEKLRHEPEFYNTFTNTCTTNLVEHVNAIVPGQIPFRSRRFCFQATPPPLSTAWV